MGPGQDGLLPEEIIQTQRWLHEVFQEAGRGLPWPYQLSLMAIEQVITLGMFGSLLATAWLLHDQQGRTGTGPDMGPWIQALETAVVGPLPAGLQDVLRRIMALGPDGTDVRAAANMLLEPLIAHLQANAPTPSPFR